MPGGDPPRSGLCRGRTTTSASSCAGPRRYPEAEAAYLEAIRLHPALAAPHVNLGFLLHTTEAVRGSRGSVPGSDPPGPGQRHAHFHLGDVLREPDRFPEAEAAYREAIRLDPALAAAHVNLGFLLHTTEAVRGSRGRVPGGDPPGPRLATAHMHLGAILPRPDGRPRRRPRTGRRSASTPPTPWRTTISAPSCVRPERYPEAEAAYREAIRLDPALAHARGNLEDVLNAQKR